MSSESTEVWTGWYRDRSGAEAIVITADGRHVATRIRGIEYTGEGFAALSAVEGGQALTACVLEWDLPLPVVTDGAAQQATLACLLTLGERADLSLTLHYGGAAFEACVAGGDFDGALERVRRQLPPGADFGRRLLQAA
ncbi:MULTISPECIES: DUF6304 family protein [unclassified Streptomyces]|uniref:DUF6304 family protein n=1 Tax=unclassified Streptomyces TaxID=2593676 RepID=UPI00093A377E|nr:MULTISPECIES: DUF6304 family protein [unclassified Streptomyces]MCD2464478.1 DUF6304 family protein [Streptomyces sp. MBT42]OKJ56830.1 hypothetical protein AMK27_24255 [Streptomyces sp. CB02009]